MIIHEIDLVTLRNLLAEHAVLAAWYAEADNDTYTDGDITRVWFQLKELEASITAEVAALFEEN